MFSLVTQADGSARRHPWVSYALILLIAGFFVHARFGPARFDAIAVNEHIESVLVPYFETHPYLDVDPRLKTIIGPERVETLREEYLDDRAAVGLAFVPPALKVRAQSRFNRLVDDAFARMDRLPSWRLGVLDQHSPPLNFLAHVVVHDGLVPLALSLFFVLCLAIALEDVWGSILFAGFCGIATVVASVTYALLYAHLGTPWYGAGGLIAGLLGAYLVRSIRWPALLLGAVPLPGWLLLMTWLGAEYLVVLGLRPDTLDAAPWVAHAASFGLGVGTALLMRRVGVEDSVRARDEKAQERMSNPVLDEAMAAHCDGRTSEAFELLQPEFQRSGRNRDVAIGLWAMAQALGRPADAVAPILTVIHASLRQRRNAEAVQYWLELKSAVGEVDAAPAFLVRIAEALLEEGQELEALDALRCAVEAPSPPTAVLLRAIRSAGDRDPALVGRAAAVALKDPQLDPLQREKLTPLAADLAEPEEERVAAPGSAIEGPSALEGPDANADDFAESGSIKASDGDAPEEDGSNLDPNSISADALGDEAIGEVPDDPKEQDRWNDPSVVEDLSWELPDDDGADEEAASAGEGIDPDGLAQASGGDAAAAEEPMAGEVGGMRLLKLRVGIPLMLDDRGLKVETDDGGKSRVPFDRLEALGVASIAGPDGGDPVHIVDLVLNWMSLSEEPLKVIRMRSDHFDASQLFPDAQSRLEALRQLLAALLERSDATPLPSADAVRGSPFADYESLEAYERSVLMVNGTVPTES